LWADRGTGAGADPGPARGARLRHLSEVLRTRRADPPDGGHHRAIAAAHHRAGADRPAVRDVERGAARLTAQRGWRRSRWRRVENTLQASNASTMTLPTSSSISDRLRPALRVATTVTVGMTPLRSRYCDRQPPEFHRRPAR